MNISKRFLLIFTTLLSGFILVSCTGISREIIKEGDRDKLQKAVNETDDESSLCEALHQAAIYDSKESLEVLVENGVDTNCLFGPLRPLHQATTYKNSVAIEFLLSHGADPNLTTTSGAVPPMLYLLNSSPGSGKNSEDNILRLTKTLVRAGADPFAVGRKKTMPEFARSHKHFRVAAYLESEGVIEQNAAQAKRREDDLKERVIELEAQQDLKALRELAEDQPDSVYFLQDKALRIALTGPKGMKVGDIRKLLKQGKSEILVASLIGRVETPYKKFDLEEIELLQKMGLSDQIIASMIDVTTKLLDNENMRKHQEMLLSEQRKIMEQSRQGSYSSTSKSLMSDKYTNELIDRGMNKLLDSLF